MCLQTFGHVSFKHCFHRHNSSSTVAKLDKRWTQNALDKSLCSSMILLLVCRIMQSPIALQTCDQRITDLTTGEIGFACISWLSVSTGGDSPATSHYHQDSPSDFWMIPLTLIATKSVKITQTTHLKKTVILFAHAWCSANILMEKPLWVVSSSILHLTWLEFVVAGSTKSIWENFTTW